MRIFPRFSEKSCADRTKTRGELAFLPRICYTISKECLRIGSAVCRKERMKRKEYLECGRVINIHGFRGTVKLESWCDSPEILAGLSTVWVARKEGYAPIRVKSASVFRQFVLMDLEGVDSEEKANAMRETVLYAAREELPLAEGDHFIADLIGLEVRDADSGERLGELCDVNTRGARDLYVVRTATGDYMVPAVPEFVVRITEDAVYIRPIPGLLDGGAENV